MHIIRMLSKSKGLSLRVAGVLHVLFPMTSSRKLSPKRQLWQHKMFWIYVASIQPTLRVEEIMKMQSISFNDKKSAVALVERNICENNPAHCCYECT